MATYRAWLETTLPGWFRKPKGVAPRFIGAIALMADGLMQGIVEALRARSLLWGPDDALPRAGRDSSLPRFPGELPASHRARLLRRWDDWANAGTELGLLGQFNVTQALATLKENFDWSWDGNVANWSRFWVLIPQPHHWVDDGVEDANEPYGPPVWDDGGVWDSGNMTLDEVAALRDIPRRFKPVHVVGVFIIVIFDNALWNAALPNGTWGNAANWNSHAMYISVWDGG